MLLCLGRVVFPVGMLLGPQVLPAKDPYRHRAGGSLKLTCRYCIVKPCNATDIFIATTTIATSFVPTAVGEAHFAVICKEFMSKELRNAY